MSRPLVSLTFNAAGKPVTWAFSPLALLGAALALITLLIAPWWLAPNMLSSSHFEQQIQQAQLQNQQQRDTLLTMRQQLHGQLIEVAEHIGTLQAKSSQLDRISEVLVQKTDIDQQVFEIATSTSQHALEAAGGPLADAPSSTTADLTEMLNELDALVEKYDDKQRQLELLAVLMQQKDVEDASWLSGKPIGEGWLSSGFGARKDPFTGKKASHWGVDFAGHAGSNIYATGAGVVTWAGRRWGYGNLVEVSHGGGYTTRYGHNSEIHVAVGDVVTKGDVIAAMGSTGRSTGPHVHYEVLKNGKQVDPSPFIFR